MDDRVAILMVDDEANVLAALKRMLRSKRDEWDLVFVDSGEKALEEMRRTPFDVIVSDIRMPGMDGAELLSKVRQEFPKTVRIALSGQVDLNEVIRSIRAVHQYITKPCDTEFLIEKINGALRGREVLTDSNLQQVVSEINELPIVPGVYLELESEMKKDEPSIDVIAASISQDVGLVAEIMKLINSPYFGLPAEVVSLKKAITMLGLDAMQALVVSTHLFILYDEKKLDGFTLKLLWEHCSRVSHIAQLLAKCDKQPQEILSKSRMAGLLHDIGKLVYANSLSDRYKSVLQRVKKDGGPVVRVEREEFGTTHAELGAYLMGLWGVSSDVVHAIGCHHEDFCGDNPVALYLQAANVIDHNHFVLNEGYKKPVFTASFYERHIGPERLARWMEYLQDHWFEHEVEELSSLELIEVRYK